jgi:hypothetical protein
VDYCFLEDIAVLSRQIVHTMPRVNLNNRLLTFFLGKFCDGKPLPTWVPDSSSSNSCKYMPPMLLTHQDLGTLPPCGHLPHHPHANFRRRDSIHNVLGHDDPNVLCLNGATIDRVMETTTTLLKYTPGAFSPLAPFKA